MDLATESLNVELENGLGGTRPLLRQPEISVRSRAIRWAFISISDEIDVSVFLIGGPVLAEIIEKLRPRIELVPLKVVEWKREAVIDPGDEGDVLLGLADQPFGNFLPAPVLVGFLGRGWREDATGLLGVEGGVDLQRRRTGCRRFPA